MHSKSSESLKGAFAAGLAFFLWGLIPMYWKLLQSVNPFELVMHRIFWSFLFLLVLVKIRGRMPILLNAFRDKQNLRIHTLGGVLLGLNWIAFIFAVTQEQVLQASLAYFIVPLVNSGLGFIVLKERISKLRMLAVVLAGLGVLNQIVRVSEVPWFALIIAASFGCYGLLKKKTSLGTVTGLTLENTVIFPIASIFLMVLFIQGEGALLHTSWSLQVLVASVGIVTSIPLLLFSYGAARIELNTLGILQFIAPIMKFFLAVWLFNEPFSSARLLTFIFIWIGLSLYLWDSFRESRIKDVQPDL
jgi:chloramphenicol-sensitive protein RarD